MDDPVNKATGATPAAAAKPVVEADEFAAIPRSRTRHPLLALGAGMLALFLVAKMRADLSYCLSPTVPADLGDARALLESVLPAPLDDAVLERIVVETRGNPLALIELPRGLTPAQHW